MLYPNVIDSLCLSLVFFRLQTAIFDITILFLSKQKRLYGLCSYQGADDGKDWSKSRQETAKKPNPFSKEAKIHNTHASTSIAN